MKIKTKGKNLTYNYKNYAFTLAEVLITLAIVGVVAAITIPTLNSNILKQRYKSADKRFKAMIIETLNRMRANDELAGYKSTEEFMSALQKYVKISRVCKSTDLTPCYPSKFTALDEEFELGNFQKSKSLGKDWEPETNINGFQLADGTSGLIAYNTNCNPNVDVSNCVAVAYDLDSIKQKNIYTGQAGESDLGVYNASFVKGLDCGEVVDHPIFAGAYYKTLNGSQGATQACAEANIDKFEAACDYPGGQVLIDPVYGYYYECGACLAAGTLLMLSDGTQKKIEDVTYDDELRVWDFDNGEFANSRPVWIKTPQITDRYNLLTFSDGTTLKTINQHRIFNKEAGKFTYPMTDETPIGTTTYLADGSEVQLVTKEVVQAPVEFYNIITANHFNCFANGICTSNRFNNLYPIKDYKFVKDDRELISYDNYKNIVSFDWFSKMRLAEQEFSDDMVAYLQNLIKSEAKLPAYV